MMDVDSVCLHNFVLMARLWDEFTLVMAIW
jgi:hypothetical protein